MKLKQFLEPLVIVKYALQDAFRARNSDVWGKRFDEAIENDWPAIIHKAVAAGIPPERNNSVFRAAYCGSREVLKALIARGVNINADKDSLRCPLSWAASAGDEKMIEILLAAKADANSVYVGESPLSIVVGKGYTRIVRQLLNAGADINCTYTRQGQQTHIDALATARRHGYADIERILKEEQKKRGATPVSAPQIQQAALSSIVPAIVAEIEKLSNEDRAGLFSALNRKFSDDFAMAGRVKVLKPLQFTRKPETQNQGGLTQST